MDRRTRAGRVMKSAAEDLVRHIGDPTPAQRLLIQATAFKAARLALLTDALLEAEIEDAQDARVLAWLNALRLDLVALGLERRADGGAALDLQAYLARRGGDDPGVPVVGGTVETGKRGRGRPRLDDAARAIRAARKLKPDGSTQHFAGGDGGEFVAKRDPAPC